jgi:hypothetical protein
LKTRGKNSILIIPLTLSANEFSRGSLFWVMLIAMLFRFRISM